MHKQIISDFPSHHHGDRLAGCPSYVAGQRGVPRLVGTAAVTHRMGEWQGRWLRGVASGSIRPFLARWKGRDEHSLSEHWSRASPPLATVRAKGQLRPTDGSCVRPACVLRSDSFSHPGSESFPFGLCCPRLLVATQRWLFICECYEPPWWVAKLVGFFCLTSATLCIIVPFRDMTISCLIKRDFLLIFSNRNCLINERAVIRADDHTAAQLHQIAHPEMVHHIVLIIEWQRLPGVVYINAGRLRMGDNCGAKCCRGWQDPFLDLSRAAVIERVTPASTHRVTDEFICTNTHAHMHAGTWAHTHTHIRRQNQPQSTQRWLSPASVRFCFFFLSSHGDLILGNWAISDWKQWQ